jgi:hypothetical protein
VVTEPFPSLLVIELPPAIFPLVLTTAMVSLLIATTPIVVIFAAALSTSAMTLVWYCCDPHGKEGQIEC